MKLALFAAVAMRPMLAVFMSDGSETVETVIVHRDGQDVRINKDEYDANPKDFTLASKKTQEENVEIPVGQPVTQLPGLIVPPAPSAPVFHTEGEQAPAEPVKPTSPSPGQKGAVEKGTGAKKRYYVVDLATGTEVVQDGIDPKGYETQQAAFDAINELPH